MCEGEVSQVLPSSALLPIAYRPHPVPCTVQYVCTRSLLFLHFLVNFLNTHIYYLYLKSTSKKDKTKQNKQKTAINFALYHVNMYICLFLPFLILLLIFTIVPVLVICFCFCNILSLLWQTNFPVSGTLKDFWFWLFGPGKICEHLNALNLLYSCRCKCWKATNLLCA